jgi:manganese transport protein
VKKVLGMTLGVVTAIGGFVDIGNIVTSGITGARYGTSLVWAIVLGTIAMTLFGEMAGRVSAAGGRAVFHAVRERLGVRMGLVNAVVGLLLNVLTLAAEIGGVSLVLELASGINYIIWVPAVGLVAWLVVWRLPFKWLENVFGILGLALIVFAVAVFYLHADLGQLLHGAIHPIVPKGQAHPTYFFYAISLFGACIVPYQVIFFSSGGREEHWSEDSIGEMRLNALFGFPLGGLLSIAIMVTAVPVLEPHQIAVSHLGQVALPAAQAFGTVGLAFALLGFFAATFAAAVECTLSNGYIIAQYFGWSWGKMHRPAQAGRFHVVCLATLVAGVAFILTTIDPITATIFAVVLGAAAIPLTYFPIIVIANDRDYMGKWTNKAFSNTLGIGFMVLMTVVSLVTIPLLIATKAGQ